jgi:cytochrome c biogenesis protein CcdA/glutaredoxin
MALLLIALSTWTASGLLAPSEVDASPPSGDEAGTEPAGSSVVELTVFHGDGCPHCAAMFEFLGDLETRYPDLVVTEHEVWYDAENQRLFEDTLAALGEEPSGVPTVVVGERVIVGHSAAIETRIEDIVSDLVAGLSPSDDGEFRVDVPVVGAVDVGSRSLIGATALIAVVDGVNPCSLWVLSMLMALVVHSGSRRRVFAVGGVFLLITSLLYGVYMIGAYSTLAVMGRRTWIQLGVALVAGTFGVLHIKEHWTSRGPSVTIGATHKPGLFRRMRGLADLDRSLPATLAGTAVLAVGVSLLETPCTAGLPLLWTNLLAERSVPASGAVALFLLYLLIFLIDELVVFAATVFTMRAAKMQEHHGQALQLIGGVLMVTLAVAMVVAPGSLESLAGTVLVFAIAAVVTGTVLAVESGWRRRHPVTRQRRRARARAEA